MNKNSKPEVISIDSKSVQEQIEDSLSEVLNQIQAEAVESDYVDYNDCVVVLDASDLDPEAVVNKTK